MQSMGRICEKINSKPGVKVQERIRKSSTTTKHCQPVQCIVEMECNSSDDAVDRLWAEIFEVREENGQMFWGRVSDDLVPVNIVCIQDTPSTVYQITAYNSLVKKIFDIRLVQPGDCLLH